MTLDDTGQPRAPVVEFSTDDGSTWSQYPGAAVVHAQRAAVYLADDTLPSAFLTAAQNGNAKVRVTASLRNPQPVRAARWQGNAFAGHRPPRVLTVEDAFAFRRVGSGSIYHAQVQSGALDADEADDSRALETWLVRRMREAERRGFASLEGRGRLDLAGAWPWVRVGDRIQEAGGPMRTADGRAEAIVQRGVVVTAIHTRFGVTERGGPRTTVHVRF